MEAIGNNEIIKPPLFATLSSYFKNISRPNHCDICEEETIINKDLFIANCKHKDLYCSSCLQHYAIYIIENQFTKVHCPAASCNIEMDINSLFFKPLPENIQIKYNKTTLFY